MTNPLHQALVEMAFEAFAADIRHSPTISLRGGNDLDNQEAPSAFDPVVDSISDDYLKLFPWGIHHLDPQSYRHYVPHLIDYALRHLEQSNFTVETFLFSLRPPDREPPRFASLSPAQEAAIVKFLDLLAFSDISNFKEDAMLALEEWWAPGALYRPRQNDA